MGRALSPPGLQLNCHLKAGSDSNFKAPIVKSGLFPGMNA